MPTEKRQFAYCELMQCLMKIDATPTEERCFGLSVVRLRIICNVVMDYRWGGYGLSIGWL